MLDVQSVGAAEALEIVLSCNVFWSYEIPLVVCTTDMGQMGTRIVGFSESFSSPESYGDEPGEDELTIIHGIGSERAIRLREAGVTSFAALTKTSVRQLKELFPMVSTKILGQWPVDAKNMLD